MARSGAFCVTEPAMGGSLGARVSARSAVQSKLSRATLAAMMAV
jgi:hypothetical protein